MQKMCEEQTTCTRMRFNEQFFNNLIMQKNTIFLISNYIDIMILIVWQHCYDQINFLACLV